MLMQEIKHLSETLCQDIYFLMNEWIDYYDAHILITFIIIL